MEIPEKSREERWPRLPKKITQWENSLPCAIWDSVERRTGASWKTQRMMKELAAEPPSGPVLVGHAVWPMEDGYRVVFERNPTPMWVFDRDTHRILAVNDAAVAEYGHPPETFLTLTIRDVYGEADLDSAG